MSHSEPLVFPTRVVAGKKRRQPKGWNIAEYHGQWRARVSDPHTGQRESKSFDSKSAAEAWAQTRRAQFLLALETARKTPFEDIAAEYLIDLKRRCRSPLHITTVEQTIDLLKAGGLVDLAAANAVGLVTKILAELKTRLGEPASPKTRNNFLVRLHAIVNWAVKRDYLIKNRFVQIGFQKIAKRDKAVFDLEEVGKLVDSSHQDHPFYRPMCCMLYTGFRQSEMRNMQWDWFLWKPGRVSLTMGENATATLDEDDDTFISKTGRDRLTCLPDELAAIMQPGSEGKRGPVFPELINLDPSAIQRRFDAYVAHCGVTVGKRTPHSCRHTWTCLMLASGENQILVQQYAGHADKEMTTHYAKQQDRYRREVVKAGWDRGELRLRDFSPGGKHFRVPGPAPVIAMPGR